MKCIECDYYDMSKWEKIVILNMGLYLENLCAACTKKHHLISEARNIFQSKPDVDMHKYWVIEDYMYKYYLLLNEPHDQNTYLLVTEGGNEYFYVGESREETMRKYEEQLLVVGDAFTTLASCIKLATTVRLLLKNDLKEVIRLLYCYWMEVVIDEHVLYSDELSWCGTGYALKRNTFCEVQTRTDGIKKGR